MAAPVSLAAQDSRRGQWVLHSWRNSRSHVAEREASEAPILSQLALGAIPSTHVVSPPRRGTWQNGALSHMFGPAMKKAKPLPHRNRRRSARHRAKLKAKNRKARLRMSRGERRYP